jgi:hypothetical protein
MIAGGSAHATSIIGLYVCGWSCNGAGAAGGSTTAQAPIYDVDGCWAANHVTSRVSLTRYSGILLLSSSPVEVGWGRSVLVLSICNWRARDNLRMSLANSEDKKVWLEIQTVYLYLI